MTIRYAARAIGTPDGPAPEPPALLTTSLLALYETDPEIVAAVIPPPLQPAARPLVSVRVASVELPGGGGHALGASSFGVMAQHEGTEGDYCLNMVMTTEQAVVGGRETYGEPKKIGEVTLQREGDDLIGTVTRMGVTFIELRGRVEGPLPTPADGQRVSFYVKFLLDPAGKGFDSEPSLVYCYRDEKTERAERVAGEVILRDSPFDPVADLPVRRLVSMTLSQRYTRQRGEIHSRLAAEDILPFAHQRYDHLAVR